MNKDTTILPQGRVGSSFEQYNELQERQFTSTGDKILAHPEVIHRLRYERRSFPIVLHIMPTERCNLKCVFCSVAHRDVRTDLPFSLIINVIEKMKERGLKALIISGGGDPTLYPRINELLCFAYEQGLEVGMITNGLSLNEKVDLDLISRLTWLRISLNTLDYKMDFDMADLSKSKVAVGFSYVWNERSSSHWTRVYKKVEEIQRAVPVAYVRLLPDCNLQGEKLENEHRFLHKMAYELGPPYFHQYKTHKTPEECHLGRIHPVLYTDQMIYPCDSLVLNSPKTNKKFHREYALCHAEDVGEFFDRSIEGSLIETKRLCPCCVFYRQNRLLMEILYGEHVPEPLEKGQFQHVNFV